MKFMYVKVGGEVAQKLGLNHIRQKVLDGDYLLNQSDLMCVDGDSMEEKVHAVGGVLLTNQEAKNLLADSSINKKVKKEKEETNE